MRTKAVDQIWKMFASIHVSLIVWAIAKKGTATEDAFKLSYLGRAGEIKMMKNFTRFGKKK